MEVVMICDEWGWTYEQYMSQPNWFIDLKLSKRDVDNKYKQKAT